jgi:hypothetical protein
MIVEELSSLTRQFRICFIDCVIVHEVRTTSLGAMDDIVDHAHAHGSDRLEAARHIPDSLNILRRCRRMWIWTRYYGA